MYLENEKVESFQTARLLLMGIVRGSGSERMPVKKADHPDDRTGSQG